VRLPPEAPILLAFGSADPAPQIVGGTSLRGYGRIAILRDAVRPKPLYWMGSSLADLAHFPQPVIDVVEQLHAQQTD
jgi:hypothetical protein